MTTAELPSPRRRPAPRLVERPAFTTSRAAEFVTRRELERQTGHSASAWALYVVAEFLANAFDGSEEVGLAPSVTIEVCEDRISVSDTGPGIPASTIERLTDLTSRTSSRSHRVAPSRGSQGQALSTVFAMAHALEPECECPVVIETQGLVHTITLRVHGLSGEPVLDHRISNGSVKSGTKVTVTWPDSARRLLEAAESRFLPLVEAYAIANPHASLRLCTWATEFSSDALDSEWQKWRPCDVESPLWYTPETFGRLVRAQIAQDRENGDRRPLRDFLQTFDGLSGTTRRKAVLDAVGLSRASLGDLVHDDELDTTATALLLRAMQRQVRPIKPARLGVIGEANLRRRMVEEWGGHGFVYGKAAGVDENEFPYLIEGSFTLMPGREQRRFIKGANFGSTPGLAFHLNWEDAEGLLGRRYAGADQPVSIFLHIVHPRLDFTDLGKTYVDLPFFVAREMRRVIEKITDAWERQARREIKNTHNELKRLDALERQQKVSIKDSVYRHLPAVYTKIAGGIGAVCRQLFYGLRPLVLKDTGLHDLRGKYIQYTLIPNFISERPDLCAGWTVLFDDRGHLIEPHTNTTIGLGTYSVRNYCRSWGAPVIADFALGWPRINTYGPAARYGGVHYCEKEGFTELFQTAALDCRWDVALASTKGETVTAARELFEKAGQEDIPIFALVDFDYKGFEIAAILSRDTRRYQFKKPPRVIVIGLRLVDVRRLGLEPEPVSYGKQDIGKIRENLRLNGATEEEIAFLVDGKQRVELNAVPTPALIQMIEDAFTREGLKKIIPEEDILAEYFTKESEFHQAKKAIQQAIRKARKKLGEIAVPDDLKEQVERYFKDHPAASWDAAIRAIVNGDEP